MREFKSISASQLSRFAECNRAWWFQYIMGLPTKQKASAALGEAVHTVLEAYLDDGALPDTSTQAGRIAAAGLSLLPKPGTVFTEVPMGSRGRGNAEVDEDSLPVPGGMPRLVVAGMPVNGFIDVLDLSGEHPVVLDHKCLPASAVVPTNEGPRRVGDLASDWVCAAWTGTEVVAAKALAPVDGGVQQVFRVSLHNGMTGRFGYSHPILVRERGWVATDALRAGDEVAVPLSLPDTPELAVPDALLKVTAMLLCDGALKSDTLTYTKTGEARLEYVRLLEELGVPCYQRGLAREGRAPYVQVSASVGSPLRRMLEDLGVDFVSSPLRCVPSRLMAMSKRQIGIFLGGIWAGDGAAYLVNVSGKQKPVITFANRSKAFCEGVRDLLLRLGLAATFTETSLSYKGERRPYYAATVVGKRSKVAFLERALSGDIAVGDRCSGRKTRAGNVPPTLVEVLAVARGLPEHALGPRPVRIGEGELWWVPVVSVVAEGEEPCFDIEVPLHHTFVAEGIITHNTTSDIKWAKTQEDLLEDPQMVLYGTYALDVFRTMGLETETVEAGHIVYLTKGAPMARKTTVTLSRAHLAAERKKVEQTVEAMKKTAAHRTPAAVEGEASVCDKYGGCDFRDKCGAIGMFANASPLASMFKPTPTTQKENEPMSDINSEAAVLAILRRRKEVGANPTPAAAPTPAPAAAPAPVAAPVAAPVTASTGTGNATASILARYGVKQTVPEVPAAAPAPAPAAEVTDDGEKKTVRKPRDYQTKLAALEWTTEQISRMSAESMRAAIDGSLNGKGYSVRPDGSIYVPSVGLLDTSTIPAAEVEEDEEEEAVIAPVAAPVAVPEVAPAPVAAPAPFVAPVVAPVAAPVAAPQQFALVLYIDCAPDKGREKDYILLEDYIQPLLPQVVEAYNRGCKRDDEKVPFYSLIPYARGPGFVAALVMAAPPVGVIVANTRFPATNAILEVLIPMADVVVRGTR